MWRAASLNNQFWRASKSGQYRNGPTALLVLATAIGVRPASTSASVTTAVMEAASSDKANDEGTHFYGRMYRARDAYYDAQMKPALSNLRGLTRDDIALGKASLVDPLGSLGKEDIATLTLIGYKGGPIKSQINQDRAFCISPYRIDPDDRSGVKRLLMGVFDGHAVHGEKVSEFCVQELPRLLANKLKVLSGDAANEEAVIKRIISDAFLELDRTAPAALSGGCTASVIYRQGEKVYIANAGDSLSFLVVFRANERRAQIIYSSREDKPDLPGERARVESMGGKIYVPAIGPSRVMYIDTLSKVLSGLAMSRSIGDWAAGKVGVIPDPIVDVVSISDIVKEQLQKEGTDAVDDVHIFAVSATDGLSDYAEKEMIAKVVASSMYMEDSPHLISNLESLMFLAAQGWEADRGGGYRDDISISVASLRSPSPAPKQ